LRSRVAKGKHGAERKDKNPQIACW
jgi:hypothetical protein